MGFDFFVLRYNLCMAQISSANVQRIDVAHVVEDVIVVDGEAFALDDHAVDVMRDALRALENGLAVDVATQDDLLTTQEAADMLGISRPSLIKLLDAEAIPFMRPGKHRRVKRADVEAFLEAGAGRRAAAMDHFRDTHTSADEALDGFVSTR